MKRLILLIMLAAGMTAGAQNTLSLSGGSGHPGDTVTVTLSLANSDAVTALQTFIPLGDNLSYVPGSAALTSRSNGHQLTATMLDGSLRIYSYSLALAAYRDNSGALLTFRVVLGREPGAVTLTPTQTVLSSATGTALGAQTSSSAITILAPKVQVTPTNLDYGHVPIRSSYTRTVTLKNIGNEPMTLVSVGLPNGTLAASPTTANLAAGAQQTVTLTYSPTEAGTTAMAATFHTNAKVGDSILTILADPYAVNELRPLSVSGYTDSVVTVELRMNNMDSIVGLQTSIKLPSALTYEEGSFAPNAVRAPGYTATAGLLGDTLTLLLTHLDNTPIHGADGVVASFRLRLHGYGSHTLQLRQTALSDSAGNNVLSAVYTGTVNIYSPYLSCNSNLNFGNTPVTETTSAHLPLYNSGNAPLVIDRVVFTQDGWQLLNALPLTVTNYGRDTLHVTYIGTAEGTHNAELLLYTNDPRNDLKRIALSAERYEPNTLYLQGNPDAHASTPEVDIMLDNYSAVTALQMDVHYPHAHFTLEPSGISLGERADGHIVSAARLDDSTLRVLVLSMQNSSFGGHSGAVARLQLHALDSTDTQAYPISLSGITSACTDGVDRLSSLQTIGWFATLTVHDTTTLEVHDTTYVTLHDTTYVDVPYPVHDTTLIVDTFYVDIYIHDTTTVTITDTVTLTEYVPVHDTTYINVPYPVHDTLIVTLTDTITNTVYDTVTNIVYDTITNTVYDTTLVFNTDTLWLHDTVFVHDTLYIHDTIVVGVDEVETLNAKIYISNGQIVVEGTEGNPVWLYDATGRLVTYFSGTGTSGTHSSNATARRPSSPGLGEDLRIEVPTSGVYLVRIGNHPTRKVVVIR